jgi:hypothetical protein
MFDKSFEISRNYFTVLQLLRIFAESIQESMNDLQEMQKEFAFKFPISNLSRDVQLTLAARRVLAENWKTVVALQGDIGKRLLARIDKKTAEVESLRDGVRTASSPLYLFIC